MLRPFAQVDVFGLGPFTGNPLLVVLDGSGLSTEQMQQVAAWANLSETTFVLPPSAEGADYHVRIFTASQELPFAGHPTLGTAHAWLAHQGQMGSRQRGEGQSAVGQSAVGRSRGPVVQQCGAGLVRVAERGERLSFEAPGLVRSGPLEQSRADHMASVANIAAGHVVDAQWVDNGPGWAALLLDDPQTVLSVRPGPIDCFIGLVALYPPGHELAYEVRAFTPGADGNPVEDPVTGSLNASLAQWLVSSGRVQPPYVAAQGTALGRRGRIYIDADDGGGIWVGGATTALLSGTIDI